MAEEEKPRGTDRQRRLYKHNTSKKERGEGAKVDEDAGRDRAEGVTPEPDEKDEKKPAGGGDAKRGGHAAERRAMHDRHHEERRALMAAHLREHKAMDDEHEKQHAGVTEHGGLVALHRQHEAAKHELHQKQHHEAHAQRTAHHADRLALHHKHETEMLTGGGDGAESA